MSTTTEPDFKPWSQFINTIIHTERTPVSLFNITSSTSLGYPTITKTTSESAATSLFLSVSELLHQPWGITPFGSLSQQWESRSFSSVVDIQRITCFVSKSESFTNTAYMCPAIDRPIFPVPIQPTFVLPATVIILFLAWFALLLLWLTLWPLLQFTNIPGVFCQFSVNAPLAHLKEGLKAPHKGLFCAVQ